MSRNIKQPLILFDGVCNLCNSSVQTVLKYDRKKKFSFGSLQSESSQDVLKDFGFGESEMNTFILIDNDQLYSRSTAALKVAAKLGGLWPLLTVFLVVPKFIRDSVYNFISKNRYRWFGKRETCWVPTPELSSRFID